MNRGRRSESIFSDKHDYLMFIDLLIEISEMWNINVTVTKVLCHMQRSGNGYIKIIFSP